MKSTINKEHVALVIGAGDATGGAVAKKFAAVGHPVVATRRKKESLNHLREEISKLGGTIYAFGADARNEEATIDLFNHIENNIGPLGIMVFNIGPNVNFPIVKTTYRVFYKVWMMSCLAGFLAGREAARVMLPRKKGTMIFTGATASIMGRSGYSAFSSAKFGLRSVAQCLARELGPKGIHVIHAIIDGAIDTKFVRENRQDLLKRRKKMPNMLNPNSIAEQYYLLHLQDRSSWSHEIDLRPWAEPW